MTNHEYWTPGHGQRARVEDRIRAAKDTRQRNRPCTDYASNQVRAVPRILERCSPDETIGTGPKPVREAAKPVIITHATDQVAWRHLKI